MPQRASVSILIVNEHAEEIKLATIGLRGFFSGCRVEVAYSAEESRSLAATQVPEWSIILVDHGCLSSPHAALIEDLKRQAVDASVILQSDRSDAAAAIHAMQSGADFFLGKQSPAFLTELLFCAREAVEKRELRAALARCDVRHQQLLESLHDLFYELDAEGRFLALGSSVTSLLGYAPQELIGSSYTAVVSPEQEPAARFRFNERRSGARSVQRMRLTLQRKPAPDGPDRNVPVEVSARGLYDSHRRFLGTVGAIRSLSPAPQEIAQAGQFSQQTAQLDALRAMNRQMAGLSQELQQPLEALREETSRLLETFRSAQIDERLQQLLQQATSAARVGSQMNRILQDQESEPSVDISHAHAQEGPTSPQPPREDLPVMPAAPAQSVTKDRRTFPRVFTTLPARLTVDGRSWDGTITNLGLGGACVTLSSDFPSISRQDVSVVLRTAVGTLELYGSAALRALTDRNGKQKPAAVLLIIVFQPPKATEAAILTSMIDAARERSLSFSLEVLLTTDTQPSFRSDTMPSANGAETDRRESIRVPVTLPVRLETDDVSERSRLVAQAINISRNGACLLVKAPADDVRGSVLLHFASGKSAGHPGPHEPGAPDSAMPAKIIWSVPDATAPSEFRPLHADTAARIGVRFLSLTPYAERELNRLLRQHLSSSRTLQHASDQLSVVSIQRECRNSRSHAIAILDDHLRQPLAPETPVVIMSPGYGQTARDYSALSYYLAYHRLRVLRYDHSNHVGLSDGELQNTTLRGMQADLAKVVEYVHHTWPTSRVVVLASDLAARAAVKMAIQAQSVDCLLLVNPVIDVGALLMTVHGHDLVADFRYGLRRGITNLLGFNVNLDQFVGDLIAGRFTDLASTLEDIRLLRSPLAIVTSPYNESSPLPPSDLPHAFMTALSTQTRMMSIPSALAGQALTQQDPHPAAFRQITEQIASVLTWPVPSTEIHPPARDTLMRQQRLELEQTRLQRNLSQISREAIGLAHLQQLPQLANLHEYRKLLDDLYALLTPLESGMIVVDAGIGQSDVTRAMLVNHAYRMRQRGQAPDQPPVLIGLGRSEDQVQQARLTVQALQRELAMGKSGGVTALSPLTIGWMRTDWTQALPFRSGSIHRIVCNLSWPFVSSPRATLEEWYRVLHPEGRLVFTTLHPGTDLSPLYRRHLRLANHDEFSAPVQPVLHYLGRLREAIRHGILHTFDYQALAALLRQTGNLPFRISPIFDGQAFVVVVGKRISSSSLS